MGGFLFLHFICPSLLAPHVSGLLDGKYNKYYSAKDLNLNHTIYPSLFSSPVKQRFHVLLLSVSTFSLAR